MVLSILIPQLGVLVLLSSISFLALNILKYFRASRRPKGFPAGPATVPFLGNLHQLPASKAFLKFHEWRKEYGGIIGLKFGPQNVIVLNNHKHVRELFDKRGDIYSSRPENFVGNTLICPGNTHILLVPYSTAWRRLRKCVQQLLNVTAVDDILPIQNAEATQTLHDLVKDPDNYYDHIRRYSTAVILASVFGQRGATFTSQKVQALYHAQDQFTEILEPGATPPVDAFPFLRYLPEIMAPWKVRAKAICAEQRALYFGLLEDTKTNMAKGVDSNCFMATMLQERERSGLSEEEITYLGGILMEAGSDTTASTLLSFCLAMISYPAALKKCQDEVDALCDERAPNSDDINKLPYLRACMTETLRWRPVAAGGIPHAVTEEHVYGGYVIPKGTILFANTWAIHQDEDEYDQPSEFLPERFLDHKFGIRKEMDLQNNDNRRVTYGFGAGRRVCSGQRLAENSLIVNMAKIVWTFDITSDSPVDVSVETGYTGGFLLCPKKYPARFTVRSEKKAEIVKKEFVEAEAFLRRYH